MAWTAAPPVGQGGEVEPAGGGHLLAWHVGRGAGGPLGPDVHQQGVDAGGVQPVAEEDVLVPLGVQRAHEDDGRRTHGSSLT
jgi:hypothetical protein